MAAAGLAGRVVASPAAGTPADGPPLRDPARLPRRLGLTGALLMGIGALGAGALPVPNPLFGLRLISLPARNATAAIAITYAGMGMLVLAWLWIGRMLRARGAVAPAPDRAQLARTGLLWALPLALAPPMFSKDVYSYLAQSAIAARGFDPYALGPAAALGVDDPLTRTIPTIWRDTPAPYGPLFLMLGRGITTLTESDVVLGVVAHRILALVGVGLLVWALPRLARRCELDAGLVLWLGVVNPLVLFHLVSGIHNEGLMLGLMLAGLELGLRGIDRAGHLRDPLFLAGAVVIGLGAAIKLPAVLALGFLGMAAARRRGGRTRDVVAAAAVLAAVAAAVARSPSAWPAGWGSAGPAPSGRRTSSAAGCRSRRTSASSRVRSGSCWGWVITPTWCSRSPAGWVGWPPLRCACTSCSGYCAGGSTRSPASGSGWAPWCCSGPWCTRGICCGRRSRWPPRGVCPSTGGPRSRRRRCWP